MSNASMGDLVLAAHEEIGRHVRQHIDAPPGTQFDVRMDVETWTAVGQALEIALVALPRVESVTDSQGNTWQQGESDEAWSTTLPDGSHASLTVGIDDDAPRNTLAAEIKDALARRIIRPGYIVALAPEDRIRPELAFREYATIYGDGSHRFDREPVELSACERCSRPVLVDEGIAYGVGGGRHACRA